MLTHSVTVCILLCTLGHVTADKTMTTCTYDASICGCKSDLGDINLKHYGDKGLSAGNQPQSGVFAWNPCKDITIGSVTSAVIQQSGPQYNYDCGSHDSTASSVKNGNAIFKMVAKDNMRSSQITCVCGQTEKFTFDREDTTTYVYFLTLTSKSCCPGSSGGGGGSSGGLSGGSILLIIFFVTIFIYIVVGMSIQIGVRKSEGKERFPNVQFWGALPGLIKDGFRFTFTCGKSSGYNEI